MKQGWHPDELYRHFTLSSEERAFLGFKPDLGELSFAVLLKAFQLEGRFPARREDVPMTVVSHLAEQLGISAALYGQVPWEGRTVRRHRADILAFCGYRSFEEADEATLVAWLTPQAMDPNPEVESLRMLAHGYLRSNLLEPPSSERLRRLLRRAVAQRDAEILASISSQLSTDTRASLDALVATDPQGEDTGQDTLFPVRSELANLKEDAGPIKVDTVLEEVDKLKCLRALGLSSTLFAGVPPRFVAAYRRRAATEKTRELRRHPDAVRHTLLAALCWQRMHEITDNLVELLIHIAHRINTQAEKKVERVYVDQLQKVVGKTKLLYTLAKAARANPEGSVKMVIFGAVGEKTIDALVLEADVTQSFDKQVRLVARKSYSHHYRRIIPVLLEVLNFRSNNELYRPTMQALALLEKYKDRSQATLPLLEKVPLKGVVKDAWHDLVFDEKSRVNLISYEMCVLDTLRDQVRSKEVWIEGAGRCLGQSGTFRACPLP